MTKNENVNLYVHRQIAKAFREAAEHYGKGIGVAATAALMQFLESDPRVQAEYIARALQLDLTEKVEDSLRCIRAEQARRIAERDKADVTRSTRPHRGKT